MSRKTKYTRLETDPEDGSDDESPPAQVQVNNFRGKLLKLLYCIIKLNLV